MPGVDMTAQEFRELFDAVSNWGRWDDDGERGALNHLTPPASPPPPGSFAAESRSRSASP